MTMGTQDLEHFERARSHLGAVAYRLLGTSGEAEDAVQEAFLRWDAAERTTIERPAAWLTRVVVNLCLHQLDSARVRRESYVGQWLPEPLPPGDPLLGPEELAEQRDAVSYAVLDLLEYLPPRERAVLVLREAFGYSHAEIAETLGTSEAGSQQALARARGHLRSRRARGASDPALARRVVESFLRAAVSGDVERLLTLLAEDPLSRADGGGERSAARRPILGREAVAAYLCGIFRPSAAKSRLVPDGADVHLARIDGDPGLVVVVDGLVWGVIALELEGDAVREVRIQVAPDKLARFSRGWSDRAPEDPLLHLW